MAKTILLADDSVTIQKVVELTFMDEDYDVESAGSGTEALDRLEREPAPNLVIADVHMPGPDGYEVCRQAKVRHPDMPVLLLVGTFEPFDEARAAEVGADASLKKPFDSQDLLRQVSKLLTTPEDLAEAVTTTLERPEDSEETGPDPADEAFIEAMVGSDEEPPESVELTADQRDLSDSFLAPDPTTAEITPDELADVVAEADEATAATEAADEAADVEATAEIEAVSDVEDTDEPADVEATNEIEAVSDVEATAEIEAQPDHDAEAQADGGNGRPPLSDEDVDRIARRVAELAGVKVLREVAWEVVPDLAEVVIKERIRELEGQVE